MGQPERVLPSSVAIGPTADSNFEAARASAHAQGRWLTAELKVQAVPVGGYTPLSAYPTSVKRLQPETVCANYCTGGGGGGSNYTLVSRTVSAMHPEFPVAELSSDEAYVSAGNSTQAPPGYDIQVNYSDGTSVVGTIVMSTTNVPVFQRLLPDGTAQFTRLTMDRLFNGYSGDCGSDGSCGGNPGGGGFFDGIPYSYPGLGQPWCGILVGAGGLAGGFLAEALIPVKGPWAWRLGAFAGGTLISSILSFGNTC
jgi:hypothetical protein